MKKINKMKPLDIQLQESISKMSDFESFQIWDELKEFNEIGPLAIDYVEEVQCKLNGNFVNCCTNTTPIKPEGEMVFGENSSYFLAA